MVTIWQFIVIMAIALFACIEGVDKGIIHVYTDEELGLTEYYKNLKREEDEQ